MSAQLSDEPIAPRSMIASDIPDVQGIESAGYQFPWSNSVFRDCLRVGYSCWVLEVGRRIRGYGIMSIAAGESHVLNLCVHPRVHRHGLGEHLLRHLCAVAYSRNAGTTLLEVRPSNGTAIRLYERHGFERIGTRRGYYPQPEGREDAFVYSLDLESAPWLDRALNSRA